MSRQTHSGRLLHLVKQFYQEAINLASVGDGLSAMKAVLFLDLSVEQMLYVLIADFDSQGSDGQEEPTWKQFWQRAVKAVKDQAVMTKLLHHPELRTLHGMRNQAQHLGVAPNQTELGRFIQAATTMLSTCFEEAYGLSFVTFGPWDEIRNPDLRRLLKESHEALEHGDVLMTLAGTLYAYQRIVDALHQSQLTSLEQFASRRFSRPEFRVKTATPDIR